MLDVPKYKQTGSNTCWAACTACVGNYVVGYKKYSEMDIVNKYAGGVTTVGQTFYKVKDVLSNAYYINSSVKIGELSFTTARQNIQNNKPVITSALISSGFHAFVVCGFSADEYTDYVAYMNPSTGKVETTECLQGIVGYRSISDGLIYSSQSYVLLN
ncbi:MAG: hypothetical protein HFE73_06510 [Firmicutes bacterium]|nr:hypothetical protein [Bacillota bacterium]